MDLSLSIKLYSFGRFLLFLWLNDKINDDNEKRSSTTDSRIQLNDKTKQTKVCVSLRFFLRYSSMTTVKKEKPKHEQQRMKEEEEKDTHRMY